MSRIYFLLLVVLVLDFTKRIKIKGLDQKIKELDRRIRELENEL